MEGTHEMGPEKRPKKAHNVFQALKIIEKDVRKKDSRPCYLQVSGRH